MVGLHRSKKTGGTVPSPIVEHHQMAMPPMTTPPIKDKTQTLVVYHLDQVPTPYAMRIQGSNVTLRDFRDRVLKRPGNFR